MASKEIFIFSKKMWQLCGIYSDEKTNLLYKIGCVFVNIWMFTSLGTMLLFSLIYLKLNFSNGDTRDSVYVMLQTVSTSIIYPHISNIRQYKKLVQVVKMIEKSVFKRYINENCRLYDRAEWKSYFVTKWIPIIYLISYDGMLTMFTILFIIHDLIKGHIDTSKWFGLHILW